MNIKQDLISSSLYDLKSPYEMEPTGIIIHNTAGSSSAQNEISSMKNNGSVVGFHLAVDDVEAIQAIPFNRNAWHAGDGDGKGNRSHIGIEICYSMSGGEKFLKSEKNAAKVTAQLLTEYKWDISKVRKHKEFSATECPHRTIELGWERFIDMVKAEMDHFPTNLPSITIKNVSENNKTDYVSMDVVKGVILHFPTSLLSYSDEKNENKAYTIPTEELITKNGLNKKTGFHYVVDGTTIYNTGDVRFKAENMNSDNMTYISDALYNNKPNDSSISICMALPEKGNYKDIEAQTIKLLCIVLIKNKLSLDDFMRAFDINRSASPIHLFQTDVWISFITKAQNIYNAMMKEEYTDKMLENLGSTMKDEEVRLLYYRHKGKYDEYAQKFEPNDRGIDKILNGETSSKPDEISSFEKNGMLFSYAIKQKPPSVKTHCDRAYDTMTVKITPKSLEVEPIYPDIIVPPGGNITLVDNINGGKSREDSSITITPEEFEKMQKAFNLKDHTNVKKQIKGRPINNNDPYPVDEKIKDLQLHSPKVKIDEVNLKFDDTNHPGSVIAKELSKDLGMIQSEIISMSKRVEKRLVLLENIMSTSLRYLYRTSSRMNINCSYWGGTDIFGKYKNIRCLHDDRINDGQSMTLDQCLSCTRYEPIIGQVYAILEDGEVNINEIVDDIQMSYMNFSEYLSLQRTEELHTKRQKADLSTNSETKPIKFNERWDKGFEMNWNEVLLETQKPNIAEYKHEDIKENKPEQESNNQMIIPKEFESNDEATEYEKLIYNSDDYSFGSFGSSSSSSGGSNGDSNFGWTGAECRNKMVEHAEMIAKRCEEGKAGYSNSLRGKEVDGILYHDCSSLVAACYKEAGLEFGGNTATQYPLCYSNAGGILFPISKIDDAMPGDAIFFASYPNTPKDSGFPDNPDELPIGTAQNTGASGIGHVAIYVGNGLMVEALTDDMPLRKQIRKSEVSKSKSAYCFARPACLVDADKKASVPKTLKDLFDAEKQKLPTDLMQNLMDWSVGQAGRLLENANAYGYIQIVVDACKTKTSEHGIEIDPVMMLAIAAVESGGDPKVEGYCKGMYQIDPNSGGKTMPSSYQPKSQEANDFIKQQSLLAVDMLIGKKKDIATKGEGFNRFDYAIYGYNSGQGTVMNTISTYGLSAITAGEFAPYIRDYVAANNPGWSSNEKYEYFAKVLHVYNQLASKL